MKKLINCSVRIALVTISAACLPTLFAQGSYEVGALGLISSYRSVEVSNASTTGDVGPGLGGGGGFVLGQSIGDRWGGEFRYLFSKNDYELSSGSTEVDFAGQSHTVHYDLLFYLSDSEAAVRPFVAAGFGVRVYQGTGTEQEFQPLTELAILTKTRETVPVGDVGVGVKFRVGDNGIFRVEFRDYITSVPKEILTPGIGAKIDGVLHHWAPMFGFSWTF